MFGITSAIGGAMSSAGGLIGGIMNAVNQQKQFEYQKQLQQQIFAREDSAVQRRAADLQKAGLSKTLAAGGGASAGQVVKTEAPQIHGLENLGDGISGGVQNYMQAKQAEETYKLTRKQIEHVNKQNENLEAENLIKRIEAEQKNWDLSLAKELGMRSTDPLNLNTYLLRNLAPGKDFWNDRKESYLERRRETFARERADYERWSDNQNTGIPDHLTSREKYLEWKEKQGGRR